MKKMKKAKKVKKVKTKKLVTDIPKKKRGRPRKVGAEAVAVTDPVTDLVTDPVAPKKRGRPRKVKAAVVPKKRGRKPKVETKQEKMTKVAKLGKRKYKQAIEDMAIEKIGKRMKRKGGMSNGNGAQHGEPVSVKTYSYESQSKIAAGPNVAPEGVKPPVRKIVKDEMPVLPIEEKIKNRLMERGYVWKADTFKIVEKNSTYWVVEFKDKTQGEITSYANVVEANKEKEYAENGKVKIPKLSKIELNRYIKKLVNRGLHPKNIKVIENTPQYFRIEFNDGDNDSVVTCGHVKGWDV